ncbi:MAG: ABC transporter permease subunit [Candidatus Limnocylindrales bacterium]
MELTIVALHLRQPSSGSPLGVVSATRRNSPVDVGTMVVANLGVSTPVFVLGLLLAFIFAVVLKDTPFALPPSGRLSRGCPASSRSLRRGACRTSAGIAARAARLLLEHVRVQHPDHRPVGGARSTRSGT